MKKNVIKIRGLLLMTLMSICMAVSSHESSHENSATSEDDTEKTIDFSLFDNYNSFSEETDWLGKLWGEPFRDHLYLGMWTLHFSSGDDQENTNNLLGFAYKGYYAGTFVNTHRDQVFSAGWQRALYRDKWGVFDVEAGYRTGMMYGYTKYLKLGESKWFPLFQTLLDIDYNGFGMEFSWAGVILSAGFYYRF